VSQCPLTRAAPVLLRCCRHCSPLPGLRRATRVGPAHGRRAAPVACSVRIIVTNTVCFTGSSVIHIVIQCSRRLVDAPRIHPRANRTADTHPTCMTLRTTRRETGENVGGFVPLPWASAPSPYAPISGLPPAHLLPIYRVYAQPISRQNRRRFCINVARPDAPESQARQPSQRSTRRQPGAGRCTRHRAPPTRRTRHRAHAPPQKAPCQTIRNLPETSGTFWRLPENSGVYRNFPEAFPLPYQQRAQAIMPNMASE
jgi:hypothetical protein